MKTVSVGADGEVVPEPVFTRPDKETIDRVYNDWQDTDATTAMWSLISQNRLTELQDWFLREPAAAFMRSKDGRGPMWWAYESRNDEVVKLLKKIGLPDTDKDANGRAPSDLLEKGR